MLSTPCIRESVTAYIDVRPRLRSYLNTLNGQLEIRLVVIDDRNASVAQVSLASLKWNQWFFIAMLRNTTQYEIDKASIKNYLVSSALYNMIALDEKIKIGNCSPSMNIILARLYKLNGNIFLPVICKDYVSTKKTDVWWMETFVGRRAPFATEMPAERNAVAIAWSMRKLRWNRHHVASHMHARATRP